MRFLGLLAESKEGSGNSDFLRDCAATKTFLNEHRLDFVLLEVAEIDVMSDGVLLDAAHRHMVKIKQYAELVDALTPSTIESALAEGGSLHGILKELGKFEERRLPSLGVSFWSSILYFAPRNAADFDHELERKSPAVQFPKIADTSDPAKDGGFLRSIKRLLGIK